MDVQTRIENPSTPEPLAMAGLPAWLRPAGQTLLGRLGPAFFSSVRPHTFSEAYWVAASASAAADLGIEGEWLGSAQALALLSGAWPAQEAAPIATVYSGHQFGVWAGQLGDGRALLIGQAPNGDEVQLKGCGLTPYSRMGDGRAVLRSSIREFLASETLHALGVPTTRALALIGSDEPVARETLETAAVVARTAPSFIRFGHFEHFAANGAHSELRALADAVIDTHLPLVRTAQGFDANPYAALLHEVTARTAHLLAHWQAIGFCHGVMNTDNMSILGLTIDYGPFQFLDAYVPGHICNHSDTQGRYAFARQPNVAYWNLFCLGQALMPLIDNQDLAMAALEPYKQIYPQAFQQRMSDKLGLLDRHEDDRVLIQDLLGLLAKDRVDYPVFWRQLSLEAAETADMAVRDLFIDRAAIDAWLLRYSERTHQQDRSLQAQLMKKSNPSVVLRNHLLELAIRAAKQRDFAPIDRLLGAVQSPGDDRPGDADLRAFPPDWAAHIEISCSS